MIKEKDRKTKGISLISLTITVIVMLVITGSILYNVRGNLQVESLRKMQDDISNLTEKVSTYYLKYGAIPIAQQYNSTEGINVIGETDTGNFYIIDLKSLDNLTLNFGEDYKKVIDDTFDESVDKDIYIINEDSHNIFYVEGITINNETYYTNYIEEDKDGDEIKNKLRVINGIYLPENAVLVEENPLQIEKDSKSYVWVEVYDYITSVPENININTDEEEPFFSSVNHWKGYFYCESDGTVLYTPVDEAITASFIARAENKDKYFGAYITNYNADLKNTNYNNGIYGQDNNKKWQILYAGKVGNNEENNIYLIASNYIHYDYCPGSTNYQITKNSTDYRLSMNNVKNDFSGSSDITDLQYLNKSYYDRLNGSTSSNNNIKAMAYMLNKNIWEVYKDSRGKAKYAIGGPSIELIINSYNQKNGVDYKVEVRDDNGYSISNDNGQTWQKSISGLLDVNDSTYVIKSNTNAIQTWVASPSSNANNNMVAINTSGAITYQYYGSNEPGFRPVVCLKSEVELEENQDGSFSIK